MPVSFDQNCLHPNFNHTLAVNPTHVNMRNCQILLSKQNMTEKTTLLKKCDPQIL